MKPATPVLLWLDLGCIIWIYDKGGMAVTQFSGVLISC